MRIALHTLATALAVTVSASPALAVPISGTLTATHDCVAFVSFKKETNPDGVALVTGTTYVAIERNKVDGDWVRLKVPGAAPEERWVQVVCGDLNATTGGGGGGGGGGNGGSCSIANQADSYVLALSWQPGFCEHTSAGPTKPECADMAAGNLSTDDRFTIHGLWPNRLQCGTNYGKCGGPPLDLEAETTSALTHWMPNAGYDNATLPEHEWNKHGTCQGLSDDDYFKLSIALAQLFNNSALGQQIVQNVNGSISRQALSAAIDASHGANSSDRFSYSCKGQFLTEVMISLPVDPDPALDAQTLLQAAPPRGGGNCGQTIRIEKSGP